MNDEYKIVGSKNINGLLQHSVFIKNLKITIISAITLLIIALIIWPFTNYGHKDFRLTFDSVKDSGNDFSADMVKPNLRGIDSNHKPYNVTADIAKHIDENKVKLINMNADMFIENGNKVNIKAQNGLYNLKNKTISINDNVNILIDESYIIKTQSARVLMNERLIKGDQKISINAPMGLITSDSFIVNRDNGVIEFIGNVKLKTFKNR